MSTDMRASDFFVAGGTLHPDARSYVKRPADDELYGLASAGELCYVLTPRQMGKSSLMIRTARRLQKQGVKTAIVDLTSIGTGVTADQWYLSLLTQIERRLRLSVDPVAWWQERASLGHMQRFTDFLRDVVLTEIEEKVSIFIDEIDVTLSLDFRDDFFAGIRAVYNARVHDPEFDRLTFVLLGVAAPPDLIEDHARTPFNIGRGIVLREFNQADAAMLQAGLEALYPGQGEAIFGRIYHWTNGHPYLTQRLCLAVAEMGDEHWTDGRVDELVERLFLSENARKETNLQFVRDKILTHPQSRQLLALYRKVYAGKRIYEDERSPIQNQLKLSGLVKAKDGYLTVRNEIYRRAFDSAWVRKNRPAVPDWESLATGIAAGIAIGSLILIIGANLYNLWVKVQFQDCIVKFYEAETRQERLTNLARAFSLRGLFDPTDYDQRARHAFYSLPRVEQVDLLKTPDVQGSDLTTIIGNLYLVLADVDATDSTSPLLEAMYEALGNPDAPEEMTPLRLEILRWRNARIYTRRDEYDEARREYDEALKANSENPATLYERARVLIELQMYREALADLEQIKTISKRLGIADISTHSLDTNQDDRSEEVTIYRFDLPADTERRGHPSAVFVLHQDDGTPGDIVAYELRPQEADLLCECTCAPSMENVLSGLPEDELVVRDHCGDELTRLTIFQWDKGQDTYQPKGHFVGDSIEVALDEIVLREREPGRAQLSTVATCRAWDNTTYYQPGGQGIPAPCDRREIVFSQEEPDGVRLSPYPEEVVLAFYNHFADQTAPTYFTEEGWARVQHCDAGQCGCRSTRSEIQHVRVIDLTPEHESYSLNKDVSPDRATIRVTVVCDNRDGAVEGEVSLGWHAIREADRWLLDSLQ